MPDVRKQYGTPNSALTAQPEVFTAYVEYVNGEDSDQINGVLQVTPIEGFLVFTSEDNSSLLIPAHRIKSVVVTPGRD